MKYLIGVLMVLMICGSAQAGYVAYDKDDIIIGSSDITGWVGYDISNKEDLFGIKTSIIEYTGLPFTINLDIGLIGVKKVEEINDVDGLIGLSIALPTEVKIKDALYIDIGLGYSPDWVTGPNRVIVYGGIKVKF